MGWGGVDGRMDVSEQEEAEKDSRLIVGLVVESPRWTRCDANWSHELPITNRDKTHRQG